MPGISLLHGGGDAERAAFDEALDSVQFRPDYEVERQYDGDRTRVATTGYDGYPIRRVETESSVVVLEGHLYDTDDVAARLRDVADWLREDRAALREWLTDCDGEFLVTVVDQETGAVRLVNDYLGRLPTYRATVGDATLVSRELKLVREAADRLDDPVTIDRLGVGQTLVFGYRLGTRTLFEGVERLPPASLLTVDGETSVDRLARFDVGQKPHADRSLEENAERLAELFVESCERRASVTDRSVVALSGGLDSRAVAAGYARTDADVTAATFERGNGDATEEVRVAEQVADVLGVEWQSYVASNSETHREQLLDMKQGMNYLRLGFLLDFIEALDPAPGEACYVTGDGGDKALPDHSPPRSFDSVDDLVSYVVSANALFDLEEAAELADVDPSALRASVRDRIEQYPETELESRYVHFLVRERGMNWLFHGEDRNRYYYWSVSPFYALPFFRYAMGCPDEQKSGERLYTAFLERLSPAVVDIEYVNYGAPLSSLEYRAKRTLYETLGRYPALQDAAVDLVKRFTDDATLDTEGSARRLEQRLSAGDEDAIGAALSVRDVRRVLDDRDSYTTPELSHLLTIASVAGRTSVATSG